MDPLSVKRSKLNAIPKSLPTQQGRTTQQRFELETKELLYAKGLRVPPNAHPRYKDSCLEKFTTSFSQDDTKIGQGMDKDTKNAIPTTAYLSLSQVHTSKASIKVSKARESV